MRFVVLSYLKVQRFSFILFSINSIGSISHSLSSSSSPLCSPPPPAPSDFRHLIPEDMVPSHFPTFSHTVPVSASSGLGVAHLQQLIRQSLEEQDAKATERQRHDKLRELRKAVPLAPGPASPKWGLPYQA